MALDVRPWMKANRRWLAQLGLVGSLLLGLTAWALATPVGSAPDEDLHIANIYCISDRSTCRSDDFAWPGVPTWDPRDSDYVLEARNIYPDLWNYGQPRKLPCYVLNGENWYAPNASLSAECLNTEDPTDNTPATLDDLGYYPSGYYRVMSLFIGDTIRKSVVSWRFLNIAVALLMAFGSLRLSRQEHRRPLGTAWVISSVPFGLFLLTSVNPSAWAIIGTAALIGPALALLSSPWGRRGSLGRLAFVTLAGLMAVGSRSEGIFHVAVASLVVLVLAARPPARLAPKVALAVGVAVLATALVVVVSRSDKLRGVVERGVDSLQADDATKAASFWDTLLATPGLYAQAFSPPLGWLEITMPAAVGLLAGAAFWGVCFLGLAVFYRRKLLALALLTAVMVVVPAAVMLNGRYLQGRYFLPMVYVFAIAMLCTPAGRLLPDLSKAQKGALVLTLGIANSLALLQVTVRYVSGLTMGATNPRAFAAHPVPDWWWDYWLSPFANWLVGSVAFGLGCYLLLRRPGPLYRELDAPIPPPGGRGDVVAASVGSPDGCPAGPNSQSAAATLSA
jgi:Predicted membrane protein (DUF2142)